MNFGEALEQVKKGKRIARRNWNGKGQYVFLVKGEQLKHIGDKFQKVVDVLAICTTADIIQVGWLATQTDMLATDWYVVE